MRLSPKKSRELIALCVGVFVLTALLIVAFWPNIVAWRVSQVDRLIETAGRTTNDTQQYALLSQAKIIAPHDPAATEAMAQFWRSRGELGKATQVYQDGIAEPSYIYLGELSLDAQDYSLAQRYFDKAQGEDVSRVQAGLAIALYNQGKITEGCDAAAKAQKSDLQSEYAERAAEACDILSVNQDTLPEDVQRQNAHTLLRSKVYTKAQEILSRVENKSAVDWLELARLSAARGELDSALQHAKKSYEQDRSSAAANELLVDLYTLKGDSTNAQLHRDYLEILKFNNYQNVE